MKNPLNQKKKMNLLGMVVFKGGNSSSRLITEENYNEFIGHYLALVKRGGNWYEYDDLTCKVTLRKDTHTQLPLIF